MTDRCPLCGNTVFVADEDGAGRMCAGRWAATRGWTGRPAEPALKPAA